MYLCMSIHIVTLLSIYQICQTSANWQISDFFAWFWVILVNRPDLV